MAENRDLAGHSAGSPVAAQHEATLAAPAAAVWRYFDWPNAHLILSGGLFAAVDYLPEQDGRAARRLQLANGDVVTEYLIESDAQQMRLRYAVADPAPLPVRGYQGTIQVVAIEARRCSVRFSCSYQASDVSSADWQQQYAAMQQAIVDIIAGELRRAS